MSEEWEVPAPVPAASDRFPVGAAAGWRTDPFDASLMRRWDGRHWTEEVRPPDQVPDSRAGVRAARAATQSGGHAGLRVVAFLAQTALVTYVLVRAVGLLWWLHAWSKVEVWALQPNTLNASEAGDFVRTSLTVTGVALLASALSGLFLFVWQWVAYTDPALDRRVLRHSTPAALLGWFIPVVGLWWPVQAINDLWHASDPDREPDDHSRHLPAAVTTWWLCTLGGPVVALGLHGASRVVAASPVGALRWSLLSGLAGGLSGLVGATALMVIVARITNHLRGRVPGSASDEATALPAALAAR